MKQAFEWINNYLDSGKKLVVFCTHRKTVDDLMDKYSEKAVKIDGSCSSIERDRAVQDFQSSPHIKLFIGNIKAAGVGLTLTEADTTLFLELGWVASDHLQAEDRVHRIGQKSESVNAYYLVGVDTIEESIVQLLEKKFKVVGSCIDGTKENFLSELLNPNGE